jgi:hypothetical protein
MIIAVISLFLAVFGAHLLNPQLTPEPDNAGPGSIVSLGLLRLPEPTAKIE